MKNYQWNVSFDIIDKVVKSFSSDVEVFSTIEFITQWGKNDPVAVEDFKNLRGRNWRAIIGKALKKYSIEKRKIKQITPPEVSPARWVILDR